MAEKVGNGGYSLENYDPQTGKYVEDEDNFDDFEFDELSEEDGILNDIVIEESKDDNLSVLFNRKTDELNSFQDAKMVNPNYFVSYAYRINCQRCTITWEMRKRGFDVEAKGNFNNDSSMWLKFYKGLKDSDGILTGHYNRTKMAQNTEDVIKSMGNGARCMIYIQNDAHSAHVFVAENENGKVRFYEPQRGEEYGVTIYNWWQYCMPSKTRVYRMDDKEIDENWVTVACQNRKKGGK